MSWMACSREGFMSTNEEKRSKMNNKIQLWILKQKLEDEKSGIVRSEEWYEREARYQLFGE